MTRSGMLCAACAVSAGLIFSPGARAQTAFIPLGDLPGGAFYGFAYAISADGLTVTGISAVEDGTFQAYGWTDAKGIFPLGRLDGQTGWAWVSGISATGQYIVGYAEVPGGDTAFMWTDAGGMQDMGDLPGGVLGGSLYSVSADGNTAYGTGDYDPGAATSQPVIWRRGVGMTGLGWLKAEDKIGDALGCSEDGAVVVGRAGISDVRISPFRWTKDTGMQLLTGLPDAPFINAWNVSGDGRVIVGGWGTLDAFEGFLWSEAGGFVGIGDLPGGTDVCYAWGISGDGSVVVGEGNSSHSGSNGDAFLWTAARGMRLLSDVLRDDYHVTPPAGWKLAAAYGVSRDGKSIVGFGVNPGGNYESWLVRLGCRPDCNTDGKLNINDFICFQSEWKRKTAYGDYDGSGTYTINDFIRFQAAFAKGCS